MPQLADQVLSANDVEQTGDRHRDDTGDNARHVNVGRPEERQYQRERDVEGKTAQKRRHCNGKARPHACANLVSDVTAVVGNTKVEHEHAG